MDGSNPNDGATMSRPPLRVLVFASGALAPFLFGAIRLAAAHSGRSVAALALILGGIFGLSIGSKTRRLVSRYVGVGVGRTLSDASDLALAGVVIVLIVLTYAPLSMLEAGMGFISGFIGLHALDAAATWWPYRYSPVDD
jgi:hypothetical protein